MSTEQSAKIIDGKTIAANIRTGIKTDVDKLVASGKRAPCIVVILVGDRQDSQTYVRNKKKTATEMGFVSLDCILPASTSQDDLIATVRKYNEMAEVDGILVQLPLPSHINEETILNEIDITKDVDGFHPVNIGKLAMRGRVPLFEPCTPKGCIELLVQSGVTIEGKNAVVLGRSNIVGLPVAMLLMNRNATVTICHSKTANLKEVVAQADIVIVAIGVTKLVKKDWVKEGAVVIDVGMNTDENNKLCGDVDFNEVKQVASQITPVPGGVGPMTIAMLLKNTLISSMRRQGVEKL